MNAKQEHGFWLRRARYLALEGIIARHHFDDVECAKIFENGESKAREHAEQWRLKIQEPKR
jgi:hypothetical protein